MVYFVFWNHNFISITFFHTLGKSLGEVGFHWRRVGRKAWNPGRNEEHSPRDPDRGRKRIHQRWRSGENKNESGRRKWKRRYLVFSIKVGWKLMKSEHSRNVKLPFSSLWVQYESHYLYQAYNKIWINLIINLN